MYIYNDEDNVPMNEDIFDFHNPTVYGSLAEMKVVDQEIPFTDKPENGCWNCMQYDGDRCMKLWNNADPDYYNPNTDDKEPDDCCEDWEECPDSVYEDYFGGNEP